MATDDTLDENAGAAAQAENPVSLLATCDPSTLLSVLADEPPHTVMVVLCSLEAEKAALVLENLSEDMQEAIAEDIILGERISRDMQELIARDINEKVALLQKRNYVHLGGADFTARMLNLMNTSKERTFLNIVENKSPELAEEIKKRLFVFEDIVMLDDRAIQKVLREIDTSDCALALKGIDNEVSDKIYRNMSNRAAAMLKEEIEYLGPIRQHDRDQAQERIISIIRRLEDAGEIVIARSESIDSIIV